jgi:peptidoglycan-associated lipoprotein
MKRFGVFFAVAAVVFAFLLLTPSCAKKQLKSEGKLEGEKGKAEVVAPGKKEAAGTVQDEAYRRAEAERQARLREAEKGQRLGEEMSAFQSEAIYFDFDQYDLKEPAKAVLTKKAGWLKANPDFRLRIEGHCDERGTNEYNVALGDRRAHEAKKYLEYLGVSGERISTISYGEERPADPRHNEEAWAKNRRDEFKLSK